MALSPRPPAVGLLYRAAFSSDLDDLNTIVLIHVLSQDAAACMTHLNLTEKVPSSFDTLVGRLDQETYTPYESGPIACTD